jgi:hypothetical protein
VHGPIRVGARSSGAAGGHVSRGELMRPKGRGQEDERKQTRTFFNQSPMTWGNAAASRANDTQANHRGQAGLEGFSLSLIFAQIA